MDKLKVVCPECGTNITTMKYLKKKGMKWFCRCGNDVTRKKINQLINRIKEEWK